ncbi:hypothetical protein [Helicobacter sp.]|uniref:hypothetical protein n=1 Tax=Helicobacter sp. TaxID=218 RepID=UPI002A9140EE|nr:hypothetical protein [Helicobacter sp.]MDY5557572.1 hypothetical protein [Helicobacter sp.]
MSLRGKAEAIHNQTFRKLYNGSFKEAYYYGLPRPLARLRNDTMENRIKITL